ncbi:MAG TPA: hypothetical protein VNU19_11560 [Candidatus Acidoferrum sp.]|jgi:hypothetical protein|nr:hypothetical protein [Candidatus Acidoferrum sp.]
MFAAVSGICQISVSARRFQVTDEERLRKFVESIGACSLHMQWAPHLQRTGSFTGEALTLQMSDLFVEAGLPRAFNPHAVEDGRDQMDRALYAAWSALLATLAETRDLLPAGSMPNLMVQVEDLPIPPVPRALAVNQLMCLPATLHVV